MKKSLSLASANILYLVSMLLVLVIGSIIQMLSLTLGLIGTEVFLILLPAVLLLIARRIPLKEGLRLRPISWQVGVLSVLLGIATFLFTIFIEGIMIQLTGQLPVAVPESLLPKTALDMLLYFIALAAAAPICEEILFRGAIQGAYEQHRSKWFAITITAVMFMFYHYRLTGLPALLPISFLLGYVVWRTQSIIPGMLIHFGMNGCSAANSILALNKVTTGLSLTSPWLALGGLLAAGVILYAIIRLVPAPAPREPQPAEVTPQSSWIGNYWSLGVAGLLYLGVAGLTLLVMLFPEITAVNGLTFKPVEAEMSAPVESRYQIKSRAGQVVGEATCRQQLAEGNLTVHCTRQVKAYEAKTGSSFFSEGDNTVEWSAAWDRQTLQLKDYSYQFSNSNGGFTARLVDGSLVVTGDNGLQQTAALPDGAKPEAILIDYEWPWRIQQLSSSTGVYKVPFGYRMKWNDSLQKSAPLIKSELLRVTPLETVETPAGTFETWKASIGGQEVWYANGDNTRPVKFDDGMTFYELTK